jgi:hypothetical protein
MGAGRVWHNIRIGMVARIRDEVDYLCGGLYAGTQGVDNFVGGRYVALTQLMGNESRGKYFPTLSISYNLENRNYFRDCFILTRALKDILRRQLVSNYFPVHV